MNRPRLDAPILLREMEYIRQELKNLEGYLEHGQIDEAKFTTTNLLLGVERVISDCKVERKPMIVMPSPRIGWTKPCYATRVGTGGASGRENPPCMAPPADLKKEPVYRVMYMGIAYAETKLYRNIWYHETVDGGRL
jgi:hypothetical protein